MDLKPKFTDLTEEQQANFGDGCSLVPDFHFTANCRQHDFSFARGGGLRDKIKADWDLCSRMWDDSFTFWHYIITVTYWLGLTLLPFPYFLFHWGRSYNTLEKIIEIDSVL